MMLNLPEFVERKKFMNIDKTAPLISAKNLELILSGKEILQDVNLDLNPKEILSLIGPNGAGKSCLVKCLVGLWQPTSGVVHRADHLVIGYMPQHIHVDSTLPMTVAYFLKMGQKKAHIEEKVEQVGLQQKIIHAQMADLSGGEWQRVLLARALLRNPNLLVLDEPAQGVDLMGQAELYQVLADIRDKSNCAVLVVSHDLNLVMAKTDNVICLNKHVCCYGNPDLVGKDPAFLELFGQIPGIALYTHHHDHAHDVHGRVVEKQGDTNDE